MSLRRAATPAAGPSPDVAQLQKELGDLKAAAVAANATDGFASASVEAAANTPGFESLSGVEKSAASLGVHPDSWKPIGFMNNAHYDQLMKSNALDDNLVRRIESYKVVAQASQ